MLTMKLLTRLNQLVTFLDGLNQHQHSETVKEAMDQHKAVDLDQLCEEWGQTFVTADGHDNAIVGVAFTAGGPPRLAYNSRVVTENLVESGMSEEEAMKFYECNILGAYAGEDTPIFIEIPKQ